MTKPSQNAPPEHIDASELWLLITQTPRPYREVDFPRKDLVTGQPMGKVAIWVLTMDESIICQKAAETFARAQLKGDLPKSNEVQDGYQTIFRNAATAEVLWRACRRPGNMRLPSFPSPSLMRKHLSVDELGILMDHYVRVQVELGPYITTFTVEELDAWITRLEEGGSRDFFDFLSSEAKEALIERLVFLRTKSSADIGSPGEPPAESSSDANGETTLPYEPGPEDADVPLPDDE